VAKEQEQEEAREEEAGNQEAHRLGEEVKYS